LNPRKEGGKLHVSGKEMGKLSIKDPQNENLKRQGKRTGLGSISIIIRRPTVLGYEPKGEKKKATYPQNPKEEMGGGRGMYI